MLRQELFEKLEEVGLEVQDVWTEANGDTWILIPGHKLQIRAIRKKDWQRESIADYFDKWSNSRYEEFLVRVPMGKNQLGDDSYDDLYWSIESMDFNVNRNKIQCKRILDEQELLFVLQRV